MMDESTRFDEALRGHHQASLAQLSPKLRSQLAQRRHAVLAGTSPQRTHRLGYAAAGFAALCALAIGFQIRNVPGSGSTSPNATTGTMLASNSRVPARTDTLILDQDPDFYAWLASPDAMQVAME